MTSNERQLLPTPTGTIQRAYRTTGVPESFIIDRDGIILKKQIGELDWDSDAVVDLVTRLLDS